MCIVVWECLHDYRKKMRLMTYNVNGIRAALRKGFGQWLASADPDIVCLQEIKASAAQIDSQIFKHLGYETYWMPAQKKGYSGVGILSKQAPLHVAYGCGMEAYDVEGRVLRIDFRDLSVMCVYMPSGSSGEQRQAFKMQWLADFQAYITQLRQKHPALIIAGDFNICHKAIDIHDPVSNKNSSGFLPEERTWMSDFLDSGFTDTFRHFHATPHHYTWWSFRARARERNLGWRIDYHMASESLKKRLRRAVILPQAKHSDHCPVCLEIA